MVSRRRFMFETWAIVGVPGRHWRICDECVHMCCEILGEEVGLHYAPRTPNEPVFDEEGLAEILRRLQEEQTSQESLLADARAVLQPWRSAAPVEFYCSFCDAPRKDVAKLIYGPRESPRDLTKGPSICNACVGDSVATVAHVLHA